MERRTREWRDVAPPQDDGGGEPTQAGQHERPRRAEQDPPPGTGSGQELTPAAEPAEAQVASTGTGAEEQTEEGQVDMEITPLLTTQPTWGNED